MRVGEEIKLYNSHVVQMNTAVHESLWCVWILPTDGLMLIQPVVLCCIKKFSPTTSKLVLLCVFLVQRDWETVWPMLEQMLNHWWWWWWLWCLGHIVVLLRLILHAFSASIKFIRSWTELFQHRWPATKGCELVNQVWLKFGMTQGTGDCDSNTVEATCLALCTLRLLLD
jgi:hypothetical protein